jgi:hypothetical protein
VAKKPWADARKGTHAGLLHLIGCGGNRDRFPQDMGDWLKRKLNQAMD